MLNFKPYCIIFLQAVISSDICAAILRYINEQIGGYEWGKIDAMVQTAELDATGDPVLIIGGIMALKKEAPMIEEIFPKDDKIDIYFQNQLRCK